MSKVTVRGKVITGKFSKESGSKVRDMFDSDGNFLGLVTKLDGGGYRVLRTDGKVRDRDTLKEAYRTVARAN